MKYTIKWIGFFCIGFGCVIAQADTLNVMTEKQLAQEKQERIYLVQLVNEKGTITRKLIAVHSQRISCVSSNLLLVQQTV